MSSLSLRRQAGSSLHLLRLSLPHGGSQRSHWRGQAGAHPRPPRHRRRTSPSHPGPRSTLPSHPGPPRHRSHSPPQRPALTSSFPASPLRARASLVAEAKRSRLGADSGRSYSVSVSEFGGRAHQGEVYGTSTYFLGGSNRFVPRRQFHKQSAGVLVV